MVEIAYTASDGTQMILIAPHSVVNKCAFEKHKHRWSKVSGGEVCTGCQQFAPEAVGAFKSVSGSPVADG
jgi:hypothetical protein